MRGTPPTLRRGILAVPLAVAVLAGACSSSADGSRESSVSTPPGGSSSPARLSPFCRRLVRLDDRLRRVRALDDTTATVAQYTAGVAALDLAFRSMRDLAPTDFDIAPIEYANGRFGEIVRAMPPGLDAAEARAQVALVLEAYAAATYQALVKECGPESVAPGSG